MSALQTRSLRLPWGRIPSQGRHFKAPCSRCSQARTTWTPRRPPRTTVPTPAPAWRPYAPLVGASRRGRTGVSRGPLVGGATVGNAIRTNGRHRTPRRETPGAPAGPLTSRHTHWRVSQSTRRRGCRRAHRRRMPILEKSRLTYGLRASASIMQGDPNAKRVVEAHHRPYLHTNGTGTVLGLPAPSAVDEGHGCGRRPRQQPSPCGGRFFGVVQRLLAGLPEADNKGARA